MKQCVLVIMAVLAMVFSANFTFAEDDVTVGVSNESTNEVTATGGKAEQQQTMNQSEWQTQTACGGAGGQGGSADAKSNAEINHSGNADVKISGVEGGQGGEGGRVVDSGNSKADAKNETTVKGVEGNVTNKNVYVSPENRRGHINPPTGPSGNFVGTPMILPSKDWQLFICQPLFKVFSNEELEEMSKGVGGWFSSGVEKTLHIKKVDDYDNQPIVRLDFIPQGPNDKLLGEYDFRSDDPKPLGSVIGLPLWEGKRDLNAHRFVIWVVEKNRSKASGCAVSTGGGGAILGGGSSDNLAGAFGIGGIIGTTYVDVLQVYAVRILFFNDGPTDPPAGMEVCGLTISAPIQEKIVEEEIPPQKPACDADAIRREIEDLTVKIANCKKWGIDNMRLRFQRANAFARLAICNGENGNFSKAIEDYKTAEENYQNGKDIKKHQAEADQLLQKVYWNWAGCIREVSGRNAEIEFAQDNEMTKMPSNIKSELQE